MKMKMKMRKGVKINKFTIFNSDIRTFLEIINSAHLADFTQLP